MGAFKKTVFVIISFFISASAIGEVIDGPANIRLSKSGPVFMSILDGVTVECTQIRNDWCQIGVSAKLDPELYNIDFPIRKGDEILDRDGNVVGTAMMNIPDSMYFAWTSGGAYGVPKKYGIEIYGYTHKNNIRPESIVENRLVEIVNANKGNLVRSCFTDHIKEFKYEPSFAVFDMPEYDAVLIFENAIDDPSPMSRVRLIFNGEKLAAIDHSRPISFDGLESINMIWDRKLTIIEYMEPEKRQRFIDICNESYMAVD